MPLDPNGQNVENLNFNAYSTGAAANQLIQVNNTYQAADTFSKCAGRPHDQDGRGVSRRPGECASDRAIQRKLCIFGLGNGCGLCGFSDRRAQPVQPEPTESRFYARNKYVGLFAQDSWHVRPSLTLNYGLQWDRICTVDGKIQSDFYVCARRAVGGVSGSAGRDFISGRSGEFPTRWRRWANWDFLPRVGRWRGRHRRIGGTFCEGAGPRRGQRVFAPAMAIFIRPSMRFRSACWRANVRRMEQRTPARPRRCLQRRL